MTNRITSVLLSVLMVVFLASYSIYTGVRYFYSPYQTETAFNYTVADSYHTPAVAVRNEIPIYQSVGDNEHINYIKGDGEVVVPNAVVAQVYADEQQISYIAELKQYENEILLLKQAQSTAEKLLVSDTISGQVADSVGMIVRCVSSGNLSDIYGVRDKLQLLLGRQRISTGRDDDYSKRIFYLEQQRELIASKLSNDGRNIITSEGGYFCSVADGYETLLTTDFESASTEDYRRAVNKTMKPVEKVAVGKVQQGHNWYMAIVVAKNDLHRFVKGSTVTLDFNIEGCSNIIASISQIVPDKNGDAVVFIKTNYINENLIRLRHADIRISFKSYSGLRINTSALRYEGLVEGVYIKNGNLITFKAIERIYTGEDFVLCRSAVAADEPADGEAKKYEPLNQFDEVIVKGTELYDGKVI